MKASRCVFRCAGADGRAGLTLVEVLVSAGIFGLALPAILGGMLAGYGAVKRNAHQIAALGFARSKIEEVMNLRYASLSTAAGAYGEAGIPLDPAGSPRANIVVTVSGVSGAARKRISVSVQWTEQNRSFDVTLHTLVSKNNVT